MNRLRGAVKLPPTSPATRRRRGLKALTGAAALALSVSAGTLALNHQASADSQTPPAADISTLEATIPPLALPAVPTPTDTSVSADDLLRAARLQAGSQPVATQLVKATGAKTTLTTDPLVNTAYVAVTWSKPLLAKNLPGVTLPPGVSSLTVYTEAANGYPFEYTGPATDDFKGQFIAAIRENIATIQNASASGLQVAGDQVQQLNDLIAQLDNKLVVLGYTVAYRDYVADATSTTRREVAAAEVAVAPGTQPFKPFNEALDTALRAGGVG